MHSSINTYRLRALAEDELPSEFKSLQLRLSDQIITQELLDAIERGSLLTTTFEAWFRVCQTPTIVEQSLKQKLSLYIRSLGIARLKTGLESTHWEKLWEGLGGTAGLLEIFSDLSVHEVKAACKAIGRCVKDGDTTRKRERVTELFKGLHPKAFPDATAKTNDLRPLTGFYQALVSSCTQEFADWILSEEQEGKWQFVNEKNLLQQHPSSIERAALRAVFERPTLDMQDKEKCRIRLEKLLTSPLSHSVSEPGFSASMEFALRLLRDVVKTRSEHIETEWALRKLILPLFRRAIGKCASRKHAGSTRVTWSRTQEIVNLTMEYLEQHHDARKILTSEKGGVLHMVAICWSKRSALFESHLKHLLQIVFDSKPSLRDVETLLARVPKSRRYALLHLTCKETMNLDLDLEQDLSKAEDRLSPRLLSCLEDSAALGLFQRLRSARGDVGLVEEGDYGSVLATKRTSDANDGDPDIYYLVLLNRNERQQEAEVYAIDIIESRKKITRTSSNRDARALHALSVWACAHASGSLAILSKTVQWAKGFIRDQLTASKLFSTYYTETCRLLSGFSVQGSSTLVPQDLGPRVRQANAILSDLLDIACLAIREPSFRSHEWRQTLGLLARIVKKRVELSAEVTRKGTVSGQDLYQDLWEDTIEMLLRAERLVNDEEYTRLDARSTCGFITSWQYVFSVITSDVRATDVWRFIDNLAKARNDLWTELRPARYPEVLTLPDPLPRGLPLQSLLSACTAQSVELHEVLPYIFSRVKGTLFMDSEAALKPMSSDKAIRQAIGQFVDSYTCAINLYIPKSCVAEVKKRRLSEVWNHLTGPLSVGRMNAEEASSYWNPIIPYHFRNALGGIIPRNEPVRWPRMPESDDPSETQEWNPLDGRPEDVKSKTRSLGPATYVDIATFGMQSEVSKPNMLSPCPKLKTSSVRIEGRSYGSIWGRHPPGFESEAREAAALAALLYLDAKYGTTGRLLVTPFPSLDDVRFPCVYLDEEFLALDDLKALDAAQCTIVRCAPFPLVHKVATTLVERLGSSSTKNVTTLESATFTLIRGLIQGESPAMAFDLVLRIIMDWPDASSWHRVLFNTGLLHRLSASDAKKCISMYAEAIGKKLNALGLERKAAIETGSEDEVISKAPHVKITTLKSLAQILNGSFYISDKASLDILVGLSQKISHIDVRVSILKSLLSRLDVNRPDLWDIVLSTLETFIPLIGSLNERTAVPQHTNGQIGSDNGGHQDQQSSEDLLAEPISIPDIQIPTGNVEEDSPMLDSVLRHLAKLEEGKLLNMYMERIVFPIFSVLEEQTAEWTKLFLKKYASTDSPARDATIPPAPKGFYLLSYVLTNSDVKPSCVPKTVLDKYVAYLSFRINPPEPIRALNQAFKSTPALRSISEVGKWLDLYGPDFKQPLANMLPFSTISRFDRDRTGDKSSSVTAQAYQAAFLAIFRQLLLTDGPLYGQLGPFVSSIYRDRSCEETWWNEYGKAALELMIANVNSIRTREWERDPNRIPSVLPDVFLWRLALLDLSIDGRPDFVLDEDRERKCKAYAQQLAALLDEISGSVYHEKLQQIKERVQVRQNALLSAIYLGDISKTRLSWLTTPELLRVDLAAYMMMRWRRDSSVGPLNDRLKALLDTWIASENEEVRRLGYKVRGA
ncbi:hypothetical protein C7974DRAFT_349019 [Boeremia exigua]|uniref:uncharacterized protein n=1 Tax=Boeremia exigua TaxID=749465 RepID=UPI001E8E67E3|nr:uncharacterized protein C7974DRAFT_349019 [Boeremia exigua]KAH6644254.1 hypothetical protein C7974DRAFT_349019 [Boeremia exigua]